VVAEQNLHLDTELLDSYATLKMEAVI